MVAVSNTPTPEQIHSMLDRHRTAALPFAGSTLLARHYHDVPLLSLAWGVGQIGLPFSESGAISILGFSLRVPDDTTLIASVAPELPMAGSLRIRVEEIAPSDEVAASQAAQLATLVTLARGFTAPLSANSANNGLKEFLKTAKVVSDRNRVVATATLSRSLFSNPPEETSAPAIQPQGPVAPSK
jgi:hypothetical protein